MSATTTTRERDKELSLVQHLGELRSRLVVSAIALVVGRMLFCYFRLLPNAIKFLIQFGESEIKNQLRAADFLSFVTVFNLGMGLIFEVPAAIFALIKIHVITRQWLAKQRRYAVLAAFVIGAVITPTPDPFNQTLVAVPIYLLFELGLFLARFA